MTDDIIDDAPAADDTEANARRMGWRPKEEYKGPAEKWVDAGEYVRQAEEDIPKLRHVNKTLVKSLDRVEKQMEEVIAHQHRELKRTRDDAYNEAVEALERRHREAVAAGDVDGAEKVLKATRELEKQNIVVPQGQPQQMSERDIQTVQDWRDENPWFAEDPMMADYARKYEDGLAKKGTPLQERLEQTTAWIKRKFPQEFEEDDVRKEPPAMVNGKHSNGVRRPPAKPKAGSYEALTIDGKSACDKFCAAYKDPKKARDQWLKFANDEMFQR